VRVRPLNFYYREAARCPGRGAYRPWRPLARGKKGATGGGHYDSGAAAREQLDAYLIFQVALYANCSIARLVRSTTVRRLSYGTENSRAITTTSRNTDRPHPSKVFPNVEVNASVVAPSVVAALTTWRFEPVHVNLQTPHFRIEGARGQPEFGGGA
jgi:hypothetical protein